MFAEFQKYSAPQEQALSKKKKKIPELTDLFNSVHELLPTSNGRHVCLLVYFGRSYAEQ